MNRPPESLRVALYARISPEMQVEANQSAESAVRIVEKLLAAFGYDIDEPGVFEMSVTR